MTRDPDRNIATARKFQEETVALRAQIAALTEANEEMRLVVAIAKSTVIAERIMASTVRRHGIYIASRASVPERAARWRELRSEGWPVTCSWIDEDGPGQTASWDDLWTRIQREVTSSQALVLYVEPGDFPLKGALVEVGMALAAGVPVYVVAPGVEIEPHSMRPVGSWMHHPLVRTAETMELARAAIASSSAAGDDCAQMRRDDPDREFAQYRRSQIAELRPYIPGESLSDKVSVSASDREAGSPKLGDMIARNPKNHDDQWLVAAAYFTDNFEPIPATRSDAGLRVTEEAVTRAALRFSELTGMAISEPAMRDALTAALPHLHPDAGRDEEKDARRYLHVKSGATYLEIGRGRLEANLLPCVVYRSEETGLVWVRPEAEFDDGRFVVIDADSARVEDKEAGV